ncbi:sigma factor-like helix-turn-helix DNA-binding protein [Helicobacter winghamensis]|uniref:sigma factor-like helix-turn-helix DNA-binding protein n=1 Tax=Helicobacter winghamensis TaxID=157268 RepID=UPI00351B1B5E
MNNMSFKEIAKVLNVSPSRAYEIYKNALKKLRHPKNIKRWQRILEALEEHNFEQSCLQKGRKL